MTAKERILGVLLAGGLGFVAVAAMGYGGCHDGGGFCTGSFGGGQLFAYVLGVATGAGGAMRLAAAAGVAGRARLAVGAVTAAVLAVVAFSLESS